MPVFSVVIPTFNQADFLKESLKSVISQSFTDFDVWIINNYSTDKTKQVANSFDDPRINVVDFHNNGVIGASRNLGIKSSTGKLVAFLDSDDSWKSQKLELMFNAFEENPSIGAICHSLDMYRDGKFIRQLRFGPEPNHMGNLFDYWLSHGNMLPPTATVVRRNCLNSVDGFSEDPNLITVEDSDLWLRLAKKIKFLFLREALGNFNLHLGSSSANVQEHLAASLTLLDRHWPEFRTGIRSQNNHLTYKQQKANIFFGAARQYQRQSKLKTSLTHFIKALNSYPLHVRSIVGIGLLIISRFMGTDRSTRLADAIWQYINRHGAT